MHRRTITCAGLVSLLVLLCMAATVVADPVLPTYAFVFNLSDPSEDDWDAHATGVAICHLTGQTFVTDQDNQVVQVYNGASEPSGSWSVPTALSTEPPAGIAVNSSDHLLLIDGHDNLYLFSPTGEVSKTVSIPHCGGVAVNGSDYIFVTNTSSTLIEVLSPELDPVGTIDGGLGFASAIAVNTTDYLYVSNLGNETVSIVAPSGGLVGTFAAAGIGWGMAIDSETDRVFISHPGSFVAYSPSGARLGRSESGSLSAPRGLVMTPWNEAWVADFGDHRIKAFQVNQPEPTETPTSPPLPDLPTASFNAYPQSGSAPHSVQFHDYSKNAVTWSWDFGDGAASTRQSPVHVYNRTGRYTVSLTVTDAAGRSSTKTEYECIVVFDPAPTPVQRPIANFTAEANAGAIRPNAANTEITVPAGTQVNFTDTSTNGPTWRFWFIQDLTGPETSSAQNPTHLFAKPGRFMVWLQVTNGAGFSQVTREQYVNVTPPAPVSSFTWSPIEGTVNQSVQFTDTSTDDPTAWSWDFGDGATSTLQHPTHAWTTPGQQNVTLTARNAYGEGTTVTKTIPILAPRPPVANFTAEANAGAILPNAANTEITVPAGTRVNFTDTSTNGPTSWLWGFLDRSTSRSSTARNATHVFWEPGRYAVHLKTTNAAGSTWTSKPQYVNVTPPLRVTNFTWSPIEGTVNQPVQFTDTSENDPTVWKWDFDDGSSSALQHPNHAWTTSGEKRVTLRTRNADGWGTEVAKTVIVGSLPVPVANFTYSPALVHVGERVTFTDQSTNNPTAWRWTIEGRSYYTQNVTHTFTSPGDQTIELRALSMTGMSAPVRKTVSVWPWQSPYPKARTLPCRIEAEDFDYGAPGESYSDTTVANEGGAYRRNVSVDIERGGTNYNVGWMRPGEWLEYTVDMPVKRAYTMKFRVANPTQQTVRFAIYIDGTLFGSTKDWFTTIPPTGGLATWTTTTYRMWGWTTLQPGRHTIRIEVMDEGRVNFDFIDIE